MLPGLVDRPLTVLRVLRGREPFMQKNVPKYTPDWVRTVPMWAEASHREVRYALCNDWRTLLWLANQRAVEYHPTLGLADNIYRPTHLVLDLDPPTTTSRRWWPSRIWCIRRWPTPVSTARSRPAGPRGARLRPDRRLGTGRRRRRGDPRARGPCGSSRSGHRDDGVHRRGPRRQGVRRRHPRGRSHRRGGVQPAAAPGTPVSFPLQWSELDSVSPPTSPSIPRSTRSTAGHRGRSRCRHRSGCPPT